MSGIAPILHRIEHKNGNETDINDIFRQDGHPLDYIRAG